MIPLDILFSLIMTLFFLGQFIFNSFFKLNINETVINYVIVIIDFLFAFLWVNSIFSYTWYSMISSIIIGITFTFVKNINFFIKILSKN